MLTVCLCLDAGPIVAVVLAEVTGNFIFLVGAAIVADKC